MCADGMAHFFCFEQNEKRRPQFPTFLLHFSSRVWTRAPACPGAARLSQSRPAWGAPKSGSPGGLKCDLARSC